jgi:hypothetical protein
VREQLLDAAEDACLDARGLISGNDLPKLANATDDGTAE